MSEFAFRKKILVCRDTTERPEGIKAGFAKIIGTEVENNFSLLLLLELNAPITISPCKL